MSNNLPSFAAGRFAPGLRIASHNVRHLLPNLASLVQLWVQQRYHVVCVQETSLTPSTQATMAVRLQQACQAAGAPGFHGYWASHPGGAAGVGVLVRSDLLASGDLRIHQDRVRSDLAGRLLAVPATWQGLPLVFTSVYVPHRQHQLLPPSHFLRACLLPFLSALPAGQLVVAGDFNIALNQQLDRLALGAAPRRTNPDEQLLADQLQEVVCVDHHLADAFRHLHPARRAFTWHRVQPAQASLIDRIFVPSGLLRHVLQCDMGPANSSDHRPVVVHLQPQLPRQPRCRGAARARTDFQRDPQLLRVFLEWAEAISSSAPATDEALINWWPVFKQQLFARLWDLQRVHMRRRQQVPSDVVAARGVSRAATETLEQLPPDTDTQHVGAALLAAVTAEGAVRAAERAAAAPSEARLNHPWLHCGERPSPGITSFIKPRSAQPVAAIRRPDGGGLLTSAADMAAAGAAFFSGISSQPVCSAAARATVLQHVRQHATPVLPAEAATLAGDTVHAHEIKQAIKHQRPGAAPGPDGLPASVWKLADPAQRRLPPDQRTDGPLLRLLARLFSAIGRSKRTPAGFLDGRVSALFKAGDPTVLGNYRPLTLLNTDHKLLAKVLANRWSPVLSRTVGQEQSAFLPGRHIGDRIWFLMLLLLRPPVSGGAVALLDIVKAFDTIDRQFLYAMLREVGAGAFVPWLQLLLTNTSACVVINGAASELVEWHAGVRQGCPFSPLLYLLVAWALSCHLQATPGIGIRVGGVTHHCGLFADNTDVFLPSTRPRHVQPLRDAMDVYASATGQRVDFGKCKLLPVGDGPAPGRPGSVGSVVCGIPVVDHASTLGVVLPPQAHQPAPPPSQQRQQQQQQQQQQPGFWPRAVVGVKSALGRVAGLYLSTFGRAFAASSYGLSTTLYHAEFLGLPSDVAAAAISAAACLVDRGVSPVAPQQPDAPRRLPGVHSRLLCGHPSQGGFGLLPLVQHTLARHAAWGLRFIHYLLRPPLHVPSWVPLAAAVMRHCCVGQHPASALLACAAQLRGQEAGEGAQPPIAIEPLPLPLLLMARGIAALGPPVRLPTAANPAPGPWCAAAPLWGNPWLNLESRHGGLAITTRGMVQATHLVSFGAALRDPVGGGLLHEHPTPAYWHAVWQCTGMWRQSDPAFDALLRDPTRLSAVQSAMWLTLPASWRAAVVALGAQVPSAAEDRAAVVECFSGWAWVPSDPSGRPVEQLAVLLLSDSPAISSLTKVMLADIQAERATRCRAFVSSAVAGLQQPVGVPALHAAFLAGMSQLWRVPCANKHKDVLWRLSVNGVSSAGGHDIAHRGPCVCGWVGVPAADRVAGAPARDRGAPAARAHAFWDCPVAQAVVRDVQLGVPAGVRVLRHHVWLCVSPCASIHLAVWQVVCIAALSAMNVGRGVLWTRRADPRPQAVACASRAAAADLWARLDDIVVTVGLSQRVWQGADRLPSDHAFVASVPAHPDSLRVCIPDGAGGFVPDQG